MPAFINPPRGAEARRAHWVAPELVAEVSFTEWTEDGTLRHPSFQGLRLDKRARDVVREEAVRKPRHLSRERQIAKKSFEQVDRDFREGKLSQES